MLGWLVRPIRGEVEGAAPQQLTATGRAGLPVRRRLHHVPHRYSGQEDRIDLGTVQHTRLPRLLGRTPGGSGGNPAAEESNAKLPLRLSRSSRTMISLTLAPFMRESPNAAYPSYPAVLRPHSQLSRARNYAQVKACFREARHKNAPMIFQCLGGSKSGVSPVGAPKQLHI